MTILVAVWIVTNVLLYQLSRAHTWNPYPFILLGLAFSVQTSYSTPLILPVQNRRDNHGRVQAQQDRQRTEHNLASTEYLTREIANLRLSVQEVMARDLLRSEIHDLLGGLREDTRAEIRREMRGELHAEIQAELDEINLHPEAINEAAPSAGKTEEQSISFPSRVPGNFPDAQADIRRAQHATPSPSRTTPPTPTSMNAGHVP